MLAYKNEKIMECIMFPCETKRNGETAEIQKCFLNKKYVHIQYTSKV